MYTKSKVFLNYKTLIETKNLEAISLLNSGKLEYLLKVWWHIAYRKFRRFDADLLEEKRNFPPKYKVSVCINIMGRLDEIEATLLKNIKDNIDYPYFEIVLLNYDGNNKVDDYIKSKFMPYIESGVLNYYKNLDPVIYYKMCHSRNVTGKLATGDIVAFVDADNYIMDFSYFLNAAPQHLENENIIFIMTKLRRGRIALFKNKFLELGGYDESMDPRWWQDRDFEFRAQASRLTTVLFSKYSFYDKAVKEKEEWTVDRQYKNYPDGLKHIFKSSHRRRKYIWKLRLQTITNILNNELIVNKGIKWGQGSFLKNFTNIKKL